MLAERLLRFAVSLLVVCTASQFATAQAVYGSVKGTLTDIVSEPIASARVTIVSLGKATRYGTVTDKLGFYAVTDVPPDDYSLRIEANGFKTFQDPLVPVYADSTSTVNPKLVKGSSQEIVTGSAADVSVLKIDRTDIATVLTRNQIADLPLAGQPGQPNAQNVTRLQLLAPGALPVKSTLSVVQNPQQGSFMNVNGQVFSGTAYELDGTDNRDPVEGIVVINPNQDAVGEMKITTQNYSAQFGEATAGVVTVQTKSGSNNFHGNLFGYRQTGWGQASEALSPEITNASFKRSQFGGSVGGALIKNRFFFFADYRGDRDLSGATLNLTVPTANVRSTCVAGAAGDCDLSEYQVPLKAPYADPANNMALLNANLSPQTVYLLNLLPAPTSTTATNNFLASGRESLYSDDTDVRLDFDASSKVKLFTRYSYDTYREDGAPAFGAAGGPGTNPDLFAGRGRAPNQGISSGFSYSFSPRLLTDFRFGFLRYHLDLNAPSFGTAPVQNVISGLNSDTYSSDFPDFEIDPLPSAGVTAGVAPAVTGDIARFGYSQGGSLCNCPLREHEQIFQFVNNWTKLAGSHTLRAGGDFRYVENFRLTSPTSRAGHLEFSNSTTGFSLADFLIGQVDLFARTYSDPASPSAFNAQERQKRMFLYAEDTWRINSRLTVNYGLRWETYFPQSVSQAGAGGFFLIQNNTMPSISNATINVAGTSGVNLQGNVQNSYKNFGPRVGFAYLLGAKTVIRAGYGRTFDVGYAGSLFGIAATEGAPVVAGPLVNLQGQPFVINSPTNPAPVPASQATLPLSSLTSSFTVAQLCELGNSASACTNPGAANSQPPGMEATLYALPARMRVPTVDAWNLTVQHQLSPDMYLEVAYVANKGTHVLTDGTGLAPSYGLNQPTLQGVVQPATFPANNTNNPFCNKYIITPTLGQSGYCTTYEFTRTPLTPWIGAVNYMGNTANDSFQSLQAKFSRRFSGGLSVLANYVYSKLLDYDANYFAIDPRVGYGPGNFDRRHAFTMANIWSPPIGHGRAALGNIGRTADKIVGGWTLSAFTTWYSGLPFTPTYSNCAADLSVGDVQGGGGVAEPCRPNQVGHVSITGNRSDYFTNTPGTILTAYNGNPVCGLDASGNPQVGSRSGPWERPGCGQIGTAGRNSIHGPGFFQSDVALMKAITIRDRVSLRLRADAFNVFNKSNWGLPNPSVDSPNAGSINSLTPSAIQRQFEFSAKIEF